MATLIIMCIYMIAGSPNQKSEDNQGFATEKTQVMALHESASYDQTLNSEQLFANYFCSFESEKKERFLLYPTKVYCSIINKKQGYQNLFLASKNGINAPPIV